MYDLSSYVSSAGCFLVAGLTFLVISRFAGPGGIGRGETYAVKSFSPKSKKKAGDTPVKQRSPAAIRIAASESPALMAPYCNVCFTTAIACVQIQH